MDSQGLVIILKMLVRRLLIVILCVTFYAIAISLGMAILGYSRLLLNAYDIAVEQIMGSTDGIVVSGFAISPFTSIINPSQLEEKLESISNITIDYYIVTVALFYDEPVIVVGDVKLDKQCAIVSSSLLRHDADDELFIPLHSPFTSETFILRVCGISDKPYLSVSEDIASKLRGIPPGHYTLALIRFDKENVREEVIKQLETDPSLIGLVSRVVVTLKGSPRNLTGRLYSTLSDYYLSRMGINRDFVIYFSSVVIVSTLISTPLVGYGVVMHMKDGLRALRLIGADRRGITTCLCVFAFLTTTTGLLAARTIATIMPDIKILGFTLWLEPSIQDIVWIQLFVFTLTSVGIVWGIKCEVE